MFFKKCRRKYKVIPKQIQKEDPLSKIDAKMIGQKFEETQDISTMSNYLLITKGIIGFRKKNLCGYHLSQRSKLTSQLISHDLPICTEKAK